MRRLSTIALLMLAAAPLAAQSPGAPPPAMGPGGAGAMEPLSDPASFLLARTGALRLTDAQVVRLAAIARREDERRVAMRASLDSMRPAFEAGQRPDSAARAAWRAQMARRFEQMREARTRIIEQRRTDRRDAITVLTPDQQARAWEMIAAASRGARFAGRMGPRASMGPAMRGGRPGAARERGFAPPRGGQRPGARRIRPPGEQNGAASDSVSQR